MRASSTAEREQVHHSGLDHAFAFFHAEGASTLVFETEYVDADYLDDFAHHYVRAHRTYERRCTRVHVFAHSFTETEFAAAFGLSDGGVHQSIEPFQENYLGFIVCRPLPQAVIGRSVLRSPQKRGAASTNSVERDYDVHLYGTTLKVRGLAFQEQDHVIAACATVALWSAFHMTATLFRTIVPTPAQITKLAAIGDPKRPMPNMGLTLTQMRMAVHRVGLEPELVQAGPLVPMISLVCAYLSMRLPVILIVNIEDGGTHAITVTGYEVGSSQRAEMIGPGNAIRRFGQSVTALYGHDDQVFAYSRLQILERPVEDLAGAQPNGGTVSSRDVQRERRGAIYLEGGWLHDDQDENGIRRVRKLEVESLLIPVYQKIQVKYMDVEGYVSQIQSLLNWSRGDLRAPDDTEVEWRIELRTSVELKEQIRRDHFDANGRKLSSSAYLSTLLSSMPRFIWTATASDASGAAVRFIFDATAMPAGAMPLMTALFYSAEHAQLLKENIDSYEAKRRAFLKAGVRTIDSRLTALILEKAKTAAAA